MTCQSANAASSVQSNSALWPKQTLLAVAQQALSVELGHGRGRSKVGLDDL